MAVELLFHEIEDMNTTLSEKLLKSDFLDTMPLMSSPWPTASIVSAYLYFVLKAGPRFMENKKPYSLKPILMAYNLLQVLVSSWLVIKLLSLTAGRFFLCHCLPESVDSQSQKEVQFYAWVYFAMKIVELLDTVFFVLRKKFNQITFLHVYHHTDMAALTWLFIKNVPASQLMIIAVCNTSIHIVMYAYYFLTALGPSVQKYLWWKRYLTGLQILQFVCIIGFMIVLLLTPGCHVTSGMLVLSICNTLSFLVLFLFFYAKAYMKKQKV